MQTYKIITLLILLFCAALPSFSQADSLTRDVDKGNINLQLGTVGVYSSYSIGYEFKDLFPKSEKHALRPQIGIGAWTAVFITANNGLQNYFSVSYLYGKGNHLFEHNSALVMIYDEDLTTDKMRLSTFVYRGFLGYRYQPKEKHIILKVGVGFYEVLQVGIGWRL